MNDLSNAVLGDNHCCNFKPIPTLSPYILLSLFFLGLTVSLFILVEVHNAAFFVSLLLLSVLVLAFIVWNNHNWRTKGAIFFFLGSFPDSDLRVAQEGQLVKITGLATCGSVSLESSYEKATRCIYASTLLHEYRGLGLRPKNASNLCFRWNLTYCERFSTDFYITDQRSGIRVAVKAGSGCKVLPLILESEIVNTTGHCRILSPHLRKWLTDRDLSAEPRLLRLEEGYVQEGSVVTVIGMLHKSNDVLMIIQPPEVISTRCLWHKLLLPVDIDGLVIGVSKMTHPVSIQESVIQ
ncbi:Ubiquitin-specific protease family C19-related protein [Quillaja saponaria]|uniref:Ubiquitin-specific protease family C19-related protein n=1 Tax=Quillaja saponaria TaxID=32244 RepID=A0AAD7PE12_QUISA|nr:Ubiquitin-specific protease family C19-related protein [Quillaja saponaria]